MTSTRYDVTLIELTDPDLELRIDLDHLRAYLRTMATRVLANLEGLAFESRTSGIDIYIGEERYRTHVKSVLKDGEGFLLELRTRVRPDERPVAYLVRAGIGQRTGLWAHLLPVRYELRYGSELPGESLISFSPVPIGNRF